jgi:chorismate mutase-like protein
MRPERTSEIAAGSEELAPLRRRIDELDREIVRLLNERARIGVQIGHAKAAAGLRVYDPGREDEVLRRVADANTGPVADEELLALYRQIIALTRRLEGQQDDTAAP